VEPEVSDVVFDGAIFSVRRERWGGVDHPLEVVRHPGAAAVLPLTPDGDVLLVEQLRPAIGRVLLEIPAGLLEREDEDPLDRAIRELREETGYAHRCIEPLGTVLTSAGFTDEVVHLFWSETHAEPDGEAEAQVTLRRKGFEDAVAEVRSGRIEDAKTAIALLLAAERRST
jgi:ADP-ribose pyrophosphatase